MRTHTLESALEKVGGVLTRRRGLRLVFRGDSCRTDGKTICLPSLPEEVPDGLLGAIRGWADHECAHAIFTRTASGPEFEKAHGPAPFATLNALEDARVERLTGKRYPGSSALNIQEAFRFVERKGRLRSTSDPFTHLCGALYTRASERPDQSWVSEDGYRLVDRCAEELSELPACRRTEDVAALALRIWEKVGEDFPDGPAPGPPPSGAESGGGFPAPEKGEPGESSGDSKRPAPEVSGRETTAPLPGGPMEELAARIESEIRSLTASVGGAYRVYTREYDRVEMPIPDPTFELRAELGEVRPYVSGLRQRLLQSLMSRRESRWIGDQTRGCPRSPEPPPSIYGTVGAGLPGEGYLRRRPDRLHAAP